MKYNLCPRCGGEWSNKDLENSIRDCTCFCGMRQLTNRLGDAGMVFFTVGEYRVYWYEAKTIMPSDDTCRIWYRSNEIVYIGEDLPYDITEDMIKMVLTFQ